MPGAHDQLVALARRGVTWPELPLATRRSPGRPAAVLVLFGVLDGREAVEETGLTPGGVEVLGTLGELPLAVSDHVVVPVLAWWATPSPVAVVDHGESATVFRAPVADLIDPANRRTAVLPGRPYSGPAFLVPYDDGPHRTGHHLVWGFTALVLDRLFTELGWDEPWDPERTVTVPL